VTCRLTYFLSHPIQYQAPLLRRLAVEDSISLRVIYEQAFSSRTYYDEGFQTEVAWDVPLREGYTSHLFAEISLDDVLAESDAVWFHGWESRNQRRVIRKAAKLGKFILMRGENWFGAMPDGGGLTGILRRSYHRKIFNLCSVFLAIGRKNRDYYLEHGIRAGNIFDVPYAVDNAAFQNTSTADEANDLRQSFGVAPTQKLILFAGKFQQRKNPDHLIEAVNMIGQNQSPKLMYVGDGEMRRVLEAAAPPDTVFTGFKNQSELPAYYAAADVFVLPSEREPWGLALNEAMASGTAVVASDQCGAAFDLVTPETGRIVQAGDVSALASAITEVLSNSDEMGHAARSLIASYSFETDVAGILDALGAAP